MVINDIVSKNIITFDKLSKRINFDLTDNNFDIFKKIELENPWFTESNIRFSLSQISKMCNAQNLQSWIGKYEIDNNNNKSIALITAGNIPLVGFHDLLCILILGHKCKLKISSKDITLTNYIINNICDIDNKMIDKIEIIEKLDNFDAIIATGNNNSNRYFEYYFGDKPHIFRNNRTSIAILDGNETDDDLLNLADDVFIYFGHGCRNVSKILIPKDYDINKLFSAFYKYNNLILHNKYCNNFDYNKAIYLLNKIKFWENGYVILKEDDSLFSPLSVVFFQYYNDSLDINNYINHNKENIQCIVSANHLKFGEAQKPQLNDYADNIDIIDFLTKL